VATEGGAPPVESAAPGSLLSGGVTGEAAVRFRERVRAEIERGVSPHVDAAEAERAFPRAAIEALGRASLIRERWSGGVLGDTGMGVLLSEELGRAGAGGVGVGIGVHTEAVLSILTRYGRSREVADHLDNALDAAAIGCLATSERRHGSDLTGIETHAIVEMDCCRVTGEKRFVSMGDVADFALVLCRSQGRRGAQTSALTLVLVPRDGYRVIERLKTAGVHSLETVTIEIDAAVPAGFVLGGQNRGLLIATWGLTHERVASAAQVLGAASLALDLATTHLSRRVQFGKRLIDHQGLRLRLGDLAARVWSAQMSVYALAATFDAVPADTVRAAAAAKVVAARLGERVMSECLQFLGGLGYLEDYTPLARLWRDTRLARLGGGSDEMMWELVASGLRPDDIAYDRFVQGQS
jgi:acyl-ACP dehydrogenase